MRKLELQMGVAIDALVAAADAAHPWCHEAEDPDTYPTGAAIHLHRPPRAA